MSVEVITDLTIAANLPENVYINLNSAVITKNDNLARVRARRSYIIQIQGEYLRVL